MVKKKKDLGFDKHGVKKTMYVSDYLADGCGQLGMNLIMALSGQVSYFYTEKAGVAAATVSLVMLICKIVDAFTDLPMGRLIDHGRSPKGKCRPWFLRMAVPSFAAIVLLFTVPRGMSQVGQLAYLLVTNIFLTAIVYTAVMGAYCAIVPLRTKSVEERGTLNVTRSIFAYISGAFATLTVVPITNLLGGTQSAWIKYGVVAGFICMVCLLTVYHKSRETSDEGAVVAETDQEQQKKEESISFVQAFGMLIRNHAWLISLGIGVIYQINWALGQTSGTYYSKYIYGNDNLIAVSGGIGVLFMLGGIVLARPILSKFGLSKPLVISAGVGLAASVIRLFVPYAFWVNVLGSSIGQLFSIAATSAYGVMGTNNIEFNEELYGVKMLGTTSAIGSFITKVGSGFGTALVTFILAIAGYQAELAQQPQSVTYGIFTFSIYIPIVLNLMLIFLALKYRAWEKKYYEMIERKARMEREQAE